MLFLKESFAQELEGLRAIKPPVALPSHLALLWILAGLLIAGVLAYFLFRSFRARGPRSCAAVALPAYLIALQRLEDLRAQNLPATGRVKEYYSILSDIVRHYLEDFLLLRAPEMTTEEFLYSLRSSADLTTAQKDSLKDFLGSCDLVKFAKYRSNISEMEHSFDLAQKLVQETMPREPHV